MATVSSRIPDSDDESVDDVTDSRAELLNACAVDDVEVVTDPTLQAIADQITLIEAEIREVTKVEQNEWKNVTLPAIKTMIEATNEKISLLKDRIQSAGKGDSTTSLSGELEELMNELDDAKRSVYFPNHVYSFGSDGIYFGLDDFWLEDMSGHFDVELQPPMGDDYGKIILVLSGKDACDGGAVLKGRINNFKLYGESLTIPTIAYDDMHIDLTATAVVVLSYEVASKQWTCDDFEIDVKDFDGPFGLNKTVLTTIIALATPIMRSHLLKHMSAEAGSFVAQLPVPLQIKGSWQATGIHSLAALLDIPIFSSAPLCAAMGFTPAQVLTFVALQKSLDRHSNGQNGDGGTGPVLMLSLQDLISYRRLFACRQKKSKRGEGRAAADKSSGDAAQTGQWGNLKALWDEASLVYFSLTKSAQNGGKSAQDFTSYFSFEQLLAGLAAVELNSVQLSVRVESLEGQVGVKSSIDALRDFLLRAIEEVARSDSSGVALSWEQRWLEKCTRKLNTVTRTFDHVLRNLDFVQAKVQTWFTGGADGSTQLTMHAREVKGQGPVDLLVSLPRDRVLGFDYVVPFLLDLTSSSERGGQVGLKLFRLGCVEMLEFCNFQRLQQGLPLVTQTSEDEGDEKTTSGVKGEKRNHPHRSKYSAEELVSLHALQPRLAVVVDRTAAAFAPGETLLSVQVGVAGKETSDPNSASSIPPQSENAGRPIDIRSSKCSLSAQSTNHIRVAMSTPELHATVLVPLTLQFMLDHFEDTDMLMECVGIVASSAGIHSAAALAKKREALGRYALFATRLLTLLKKYLSSPQLQVSTQAAVRVIANGRDVVICLENEFQDKAVLQLNAVVNLKEVVDDVLGLAKAFVKGTSASSVGTKN